jgi:hypothetical protein
MRFRVQDHLKVVISLRPDLFERVYPKYPNLVPSSRFDAFETFSTFYHRSEQF